MFYRRLLLANGCSSIAFCSTINEGIRVNVFSPGPVNTSIYDRLGMPAESLQCTKYLSPVNDILELTSGKWRLHIIMALMCVGPMRFKQLQREVPGISGKVLSGELKELETNQILARKIYDTYPVTVEYSLTDYGRTLEEVVHALRSWGLKHRERMME